MTKKLLPTVIGMILAGGVGVAQADVQLFGQIDESLVYVKGGEISSDDPATDGTNYYNGDNGTAALVSEGENNTQLVCTGCRIGVKGSEDLGNGLKALFFLDWEYDINGNGAYGNPTNGGFQGRDQWVGMGGNFGQMQAGTMSTVYKAWGAMLDPIYDTVAQQRNIGLQSNLHNGRGESGEGRATNTVGYKSPNWNGLQLAATYTIVNDSVTPRNPNPFSAGVSYENGGLLVNAAYVDNMTGGDDAAASAGAKFTFNNFAVFGQYEKDMGLITDSNTGTLGQDNDGDGADVWMAGGSYTMGNNMLVAAYGQGGNAKTTDNAILVPPAGSQNVTSEEYKSWEVVGVHNFSKRTFAYLGYVGSQVDNDDVDQLNVFTTGMRHSF
jgi:predicted porin